MGEINKLPTSQLTDKQLKFSYWYVTNKLLLRKITIIFLIVISIILWFYVFIGLLIFLFSFERIDSQIKQSLFSPADTSWSAESAAPKAINLGSNLSFPGFDGTFDLATEIKNPNSAWLAEFDYNFRSFSTSSVIQKGFILPGEVKYLMDLGGPSSEASLEIRNIKWKRIVRYEDIKQSHYRFIIENQEFFPSAKKEDPSRIKFEVVNDSPYGYWEAGVIVELYSGGNLVSINRAPLSAIKAGERRVVELNWLQELPNIDNIIISVDVNFLDEANIMPPSYQL